MKNDLVSYKLGKIAVNRPFQVQNIPLPRMKYLRMYCSFWSSVASAGKTVGIPGMKVLSASSFAHLDFLFFFLSGGGQLADSI